MTCEFLFAEKPVISGTSSDIMQETRNTDCEHDF